MGVGILALTALVLLLGAVIQGSLGIGLAVVSVPFLGVLVPSRVPQLFILLGVPISIAMAVRERKSINCAVTLRMLGGWAPGGILGGLVVRSADISTLRLMVGGTTLLVALGLAINVDPFGRGRYADVIAGFVGGLLTTSVGLGGPPVAMHLSDREPAQMRATLGTVFVGGNLMSLTSLVVSGRVGGGDLWLALGMLPAVALGFALSSVLTARVAAHSIQRGVLAICAIGGTWALLSGLRTV